VTSTEHKDEGELEPSLPDFFFNFRTLDPQLRVLTAIATAQVFATALLLLLREFPAWRPLPLQFDKWLGSATIPIPHYVFSCILVFVGIGLFMTGIMQADRRGALRVLYLIGLAYLLIILGEGAGAGVYIVTTLTILALWGLSIAFVEAYLRRPNSQPKAVLRALPWAYFALTFAFTSFVTVRLLMLDATTFGIVLLWLRTPVTALFLLAAVDWAEIADTLVRSSVRKVPSQRQDMIVTCGSVLTVSGVLLLTGHWLSQVGWDDFARMSAVDLVAVVGVLTLLRVARFDGTWPIHFPWTSLVVTIGVFALTAIMTLQIFGGWVYHGILFAIVMGALLSVSRRKGSITWLAPTMLFGLFAGISAILWSVSSPSTLIRESMTVVGSAYLMAAIDANIVTVVLLAWMRAKGRGAGDLRPPLRILLIFNCSLCLAFILTRLYAAGLHAAESLVVIDTIFFLVAVIWDILVSGHSLTNMESPWFPRRSRVLLFFSFITLTLAFVLFWASVQGPDERLKMTRLALNPDFAILNGLVVFAPAMLLTLFVLRVGKWAAGERIFPTALVP